MRSHPAKHKANAAEVHGLAPVAFLSLVVGVTALGATALSGLSAMATRSDDRSVPQAQTASLRVMEQISSRHAEPAEPKAEVPAARAAAPVAIDGRPASTRITVSSRSAPEPASAPAADTAPRSRLPEPGVPDVSQASAAPEILAATSALPARGVPRLKPRKRPAGVEVVHSLDPRAAFVAPAVPVAFALADDFTGGRESLFAEYAQARMRSLEERAYLTVVLNRGETVAKTLTALGATAEEVAGMLAAAGKVSSPDGLKAGTAIDYAFDSVPAASGGAILSEEDGLSAELGEARYDMVLSRLRYRPDNRHLVTAWRRPDGAYEARVEELDVEKRFAAVAGVIHHSLFMAGHRSNVPPEIMQRFANLFLYDIDFARDIRSGDRFEVVYEVFHDAEGRYVGSGDIVFAGMSWHGNRDAKGYYRFEEGGDVSLPYFDVRGESAARLLMKTPIEGARVTSHFGKRKHPVLGYTKQHKGVDFGAPSGTPIMAAGDGKVVRADRFGSFGNYVKIEHANGYSTAYAHLKGFASGVSAGTRVKQGDIIGYVGTTGRSTGPHLHYEVHKSGDVQNPMTLDVANGRVLEGGVFATFDTHRTFVDTIRVHPLTVAVATPE